MGVSLEDKQFIFRPGLLWLPVWSLINQRLKPATLAEATLVVGGNLAAERAPWNASEKSLSTS